MAAISSQDGLFLTRLSVEVVLARKKYPAPNPTLAALTEEVGELARALLHIREGKSCDWQAVYDETVQVAAMAMRIAIEGDETIGATRQLAKKGGA